ncbi:MAG: transcriptional repressor [Verrucomicrobia bacterium]|nr:transcriptional repressor [Verrucomicrobiota bacterium]
MIRRTRQREAIEEVFQASRRPLAPGEVHEAALPAYPGLGLRTVYRQLKDMVDEGLIVGVDYPGQPLRYEWVSEKDHAHFICRRCRRVYDLEVDVPDVEITAPRGFTVMGQETVFYGLCPECGEGS